MRLIRYFVFPVSGFVFTIVAGSQAFADEAPEPKPLGVEYCFSVENLVKLLGKFDDLKASKRDTVGPDLMMTLILDDGELMPERVELRDGETIRQISFNAKNQTVGLTDVLSAASEDSKFCVIDPAREGRFFKEVGYSLDFGTGVRFKNTTGAHSLEELNDGLKDGRSHYKKMAGAMGFMVPKFDYIVVAGEDELQPPIVVATSQDKDIGVPAFELFNGGRMIDIDTLEDMGADGIRVESDDYRMTPSPDAKTVAKFSGGG